MSKSALEFKSKFVVTDAPSALPGSCFICGSHDRKQFIDLQRSFEFHGAVYICVDECLRELMNVLNFLTGEQAKVLAERVLYLEKELVIAQKKIDLLQKITGNLDEYKQLTPSDNSKLLSDFDSVDDVLSDVEYNQVDAEEPPRTDSKVKRSSEQRNESGNDKNLGELSSDRTGSDTILNL